MKICRTEKGTEIKVATKTSGGRSKMKTFKVADCAANTLGLTLEVGQSANFTTPIRLVPIDEVIEVGGLRGPDDTWLVPPQKKTISIYKVELVE